MPPLGRPGGRHHERPPRSLSFAGGIVNDDNPADLLRLEERLIEAACPFAVVTVIRTASPTSTWVGAQALVEADGALHGWIGGGCSRFIVIPAAQEAHRTGLPTRFASTQN